MKIRPVGAEGFHADRRAADMKLSVALRSFAKVPIKGKMIDFQAIVIAVNIDCLKF